MKKFLKLAIIPAAFLTIGLTTGCNVAKKEVALITDVGDIDDGSFNQASWEAIKEYCTTNHKTYDYYRPFADSDFARRCAIKQAVYKGAKVIVCPGFKFANAVSQAQNDYKDVHFMLLDSATSNDVNKNTVCVGYKCEISGYLAGYTIAQDLMQYDIDNNIKTKNYNYGYCGGMATDGVLQFGFGFIQGCTCGTKDFWEANKQKIGDLPNVNFKYNYAGVFAQSDDAASKMKGWYAGSGKDDEIKAVFACGGKLFQSITEGVKDYNRKNNYYDKINEGKISEGYVMPRNCARWVGVDSDQYKGLTDEHEKKTIYTSALKGLDPTIQTALKYHFAGKWEDVIGGSYSDTSKQWTLGLKSKFGRPGHDIEIEEKDYVGIPEVTKENSDVLRGFYNYTHKQYTDELKKLNDDSVYGGNGTDLVDSEGKSKAVDIGNPDFMNKTSDEYFVKDASGKPVKFSEKYLKNFPQAQLSVTVID